MTVKLIEPFGGLLTAADLDTLAHIEREGDVDAGNGIILQHGAGPTLMPSGRARDTAPNALTFNGSLTGSTVKIDIGSNIAEGIVACYIRVRGQNPARGSTYDSMISFRDDPANYWQATLSFKVNTDTDTYPQIAGWPILRYAYTGAYIWEGQDEGETEDFAFELDRWYYVELLMMTADSGHYELRVDGQVWAKGNSDLKAGSNAYFNMLHIGNRLNNYSSSGHGLIWDISDLYVVDTGASPNDTFLYPAVISAQRPGADTAQADFTPQSGADNYAMLNDDTTDADTTFNDSDTAAHKDRFTSTDALPENSGGARVLAVQPMATVRDDADLGTRTFRTLLKEGATETAGTTATLTESGYQQVRGALHETNPDTGSAWTITEAESAEFGYELVS